MFIIWKVLQNLPKGDKGKITLFKRLEVESRSLSFVVLAIVLIGAPIYMATRFAGDPPLLMAASPDQHEGEIEIENPDLSAFVFLRDDSVLTYVRVRRRRLRMCARCGMRARGIMRSPT
ncbi:MAG: hypothetical protein U0R19_18775 [Bryobacteraceae bacterium]